VVRINGSRLLPELHLSRRHWLFGSRRPIERQDILGYLRIRNSTIRRLDRRQVIGKAVASPSPEDWLSH